MLANRKPPWKLKDALLVLILLVAAGYGFSLFLRWARPSLSLSRQFLLAGLVQAVAVLGGLHYVVRVKYGGSLAQLGLKGHRFGRAFFLGVVGGTVLFILVILAGALLQNLLPDPAPQPFAELVRRARSFRDLLVPLFLGAFLAPLTEELYFRGFLYPILKARYGLLAGQILSSLVFALLHFDWLRFLPLAMGGLGLVYLYERSGSLITPVVAHGTWNTIMILIIYVSLHLA
ncbi:MAG: CPBP family intramembrane metalloprotease [Thermoanaerobacteraceae bacterium]|nr:CPBP family intramembrane metalloprotease [Thermoanaerobacteraceae bacterium]